MYNDPIVEEIHRIREEIAKRFNYDLEAIVRDAQRRQHESGAKVVRREPRRIEPAPVSQSQEP